LRTELNGEELEDVVKALERYVMDITIVNPTSKAWESEKRVVRLRALAENLAKIVKESSVGAVFAFAVEARP